MKMEGTECSETLTYKIQTPENYPEESTQQCYIYYRNCSMIFMNHFQKIKVSNF